MNGVPRVDEIRSISRTAVSAVTVVFREGVDVWFARQMVSERLKLAENDIPPGYGRPELGPGVDGAGRDLRVLSGVEEAHADGAAHDARLGRGDQAARRPRRRRGQRHGRRGQAVSGRPRPQAAGGLSAVARRHREHPREEQRRHRRRLHREEPGVVRHSRRRPVPQHRGDREHGGDVRCGRNAGPDQAARRRAHRTRAAVRRGHQTRRRRDRRGHGHDADRIQFARRRARA